MVDRVARLKVGKLTFETMVDLDAALKLKKGENVDINEVIRDVAIYTDIKKGMKAGKAELENAFGTSDFAQVVEKIVKKGKIEVSQEYREKELEAKKKQIIDFLTKNAVDVRTDMPFTPDVLESSLEEEGIRIENKPIDAQINRIIEELSKAIPIKLKTKKIKIKIPPEYTARVYGIIKENKEKEEWLGDGSLVVVVNLPIGMVMDFYDKLNSLTHGSVITEEIKEEKNG